MKKLNDQEELIRVSLSKGDAIHLCARLDVPLEKAQEACNDYVGAAIKYHALITDGKYSDLWQLTLDFQKFVLLLIHGLIYEAQKHD